MNSNRISDLAASVVVSLQLQTSASSSNLKAK